MAAMGGVRAGGGGGGGKRWRRGKEDGRTQQSLCHWGKRGTQK